MTKQLSVLAVAAVVAAGAWAGLSAQQEMLPRPGPGSGITPVRIVNEPAVTVSGLSEVRVSGPVTVSVRVPSFASKGRTLLITWTTGEQERLVVADLLVDGWIAVDQSGGTRFVNLGTARSVQVAR